MEIYREVADYIFKNDKLFDFLEAGVVEASYGRATVEMVVLERHLNAAGVCQGGVIFTLADLAFAIASNSYGKLALAIDSSIRYMKSAFLGDKLIAKAFELGRTNKLGFYRVDIERDGEKIAFFEGTVFIFDRSFFEAPK
ncbi:MAG: PaaI family thioesterase [Thermosulfidibacteraceae bacterium]|jgi:acyl-CoA thioesterase